jgi:hypothetical protein
MTGGDGGGIENKDDRMVRRLILNGRVGGRTM